MLKMKREGGFTLIELMIVVAIIGILAAVAIPRFADLVARAQEAATKGSLSSVRSALTIYYGGTGGELPDQTADNPLRDALVDEYIRELPSGNIPRGGAESLGGEGDGLRIPEGESQGLAAGTANATAAEDGWAYNRSDMHIWIPDHSADTGGDYYHTW